MDAPVQLVVFSDFQCRFCADLAAVLKRIQTEFPEKVLVAYRYFPIESHDRAMPAAIAAECAAEQGKFWEYHDRLFAERGNLTDSTLLSLATAIGMDLDRFQQCQNSGRAREVVEISRKEAVNLGLEGAPIIALNGRIIGGVVSYEKLRGAVLEALNAVASDKTTSP
jgi:protein-disulfide isomerase